MVMLKKKATYLRLYCMRLRHCGGASFLTLSKTVGEQGLADGDVVTVFFEKDHRMRKKDRRRRRATSRSAWAKLTVFLDRRKKDHRRRYISRSAWAKLTSTSTSFLTEGQAGKPLKQAKLVDCWARPALPPVAAADCLCLGVQLLVC